MNMLQDDYVYRLLLRTVLAPCGAPDARHGLRPSDLAKHLRKVGYVLFNSSFTSYEVLNKEPFTWWHHSLKRKLVDLDMTL